MNEPEIWTDNYTVGSYQTDKQGKLYLHSLAHFFQESAWRHAEACNSGYHDLQKHGKLWVLAGLKIKIIEYPLWGQKITVNTWGNNVEGLFAYREYELSGITGEVMAAANSSWLIMDQITHRPCRITDEFRKIPCRGIYSLAGQSRRLPALKSSSVLDTMKIQFSDIDLQQHVNNARYIEWCVNRLPVDPGSDHFIEELEINYLNECQLGDQIRFFSGNHPEPFCLSAINTTKGKEVFRACLGIRKRDSSEGSANLNDVLFSPR